MVLFKQDLNQSMLKLTVAVLFLFVLSSFYYHLLLSNIQDNYDLKVKHLEELEKKILDQEKKLKESYGSKKVIEEDKKILEKNYVDVKKKNFELRLQTAGLEKNTKPFSKYLCKSTGNVKCLN
jgi:hypothetical protein